MAPRIWGVLGEVVTVLFEKLFGYKIETLGNSIFGALPWEKLAEIIHAQIADSCLSMTMNFFMTHRPARNGFRVFCEDEQNSEEHEKMPPSVFGFEHYRSMFLFCGKSELFPDFQDQIIHLILCRIQ